MEPCDSPAYAWRQGLKTGPDATLWLARAARLAPDDPRITLDLARAQLNGDTAAIQHAATLFESIATRHDSLFSWLGLAMARHRLGAHKAAAAALAELLSRHCAPADASFGTLANRIAHAAGYDGFCGISATGQTLGHATGNLLGAPDEAALSRVIGLAEYSGDSLSGWATRPAAPDVPPAVTLTDANGRHLAVTFGKPLPADDDAPLLPRHPFKISPSKLRTLTPPFALTGPNGAQLMGSPLDPAFLQIPPIPAAHRGPAVTHLPERRPLTILIPVYRGVAETQACLASLTTDAQIIVIDDASPDPALTSWLDTQATVGNVKLLRHPRNQGFPAAVNTGLAAAAGHDILLLNSDTLVPPGAIETLHGLAYAHPATASVTPLSNEASILSYPEPNGGNPMPTLAVTKRLNKLAARANGLKTHEIPTAIGFCMFMRHDALARVAGFRPELFAQGYGEENDWCIRARHAGYTHQAAIGVYVAHRGGTSFGAAARGLTLRNLRILNIVYPGYHELVMSFIHANPLRPARAALDEAYLRQDTRASVLLISHSHGGGVARQLAAQAEALKSQGLRVLTLTTQFPEDPETTPYPWPAQLNSDDWETPNLVFNLATEKPKLLRLLKTLRIQSITLHHTLGHHPAIRTLAAALKIPQDIIIHDYASFCPRVNLLTPDTPPRYCGEPALPACTACAAADPETVYEDLPVPALLARSRAEFKAAATLIAPSADTARRITRHFPGIAPTITPWEDDTQPIGLHAPRLGPRRIAIIGGIGPSKGFDILLACATDATTRNLPLKFLVAGRSADDAKLLEAGIFLTGHYQEPNAQQTIQSLHADLAFLPSIWPETWCFALSEAWRAGLHAITFDLGAQRDRVLATGRGATLPLGLPPNRINDFLLTWTPK